VYWKCENQDCKGRGNSPPDMGPHLKVTKCHDLWHEPLLVKREVCPTINKFKQASISENRKGKKTRNILKSAIKDLPDDVLIHLLSDSALRQQVNRANKKEKPIVEPKLLKDLIIDDHFRKTYKGENFLLG
jgi:hypothetical protein